MVNNPTMKIARRIDNPKIAAAAESAVTTPLPNARGWLAEALPATPARFEYVSRNSVLPSRDTLGEPYSWTKRDGTKVEIRDRHGPGISSQLVLGIHTAYAEHVALVLRPEVLWFAIVNQAAHFVKELRKMAEQIPALEADVAALERALSLLGDAPVEGSATTAEQPTGTTLPDQLEAILSSERRPWHAREAVKALADQGRVTNLGSVVGALHRLAAAGRVAFLGRNKFEILVGEGPRFLGKTEGLQSEQAGVAKQ